MAEISLARSAQESLEQVECFRHEGDECPRCDGRASGPADVAPGAVSRPGDLAKAARHSSGSRIGGGSTSPCTA